MSAGFPTPMYCHAGRGAFRDVYEPAEDSFLLIDALEKDAERLQLMRPAARCTDDSCSTPRESTSDTADRLCDAVKSTMSNELHYRGGEHPKLS
ncbi:HemK methyltransferase family member 2 [Collichthys lucidus]|uniref:HemK methyltransferase family member 2 n=1 Tax=Collichthys lucidus TaxID=240159 RepID=A0A4U5TYH3_COLLU|nr:HemK methyltransferase family member 2 [Collichthys lucidus]